MYFKCVFWKKKPKNTTQGESMLVQFSVKNFRSIRDEQTLSLVKGKGSELPENTFQPEAPATEELLRSCVIYGPNAAGKTSLISSLAVMRSFVVRSFNFEIGEDLPVTPFRLDPEAATQPSEFEVIFVLDNVRYQYGFSATKKQIIEEWLLAYPNGRAQRWFDRIWNSSKKEYQWEFGNNLTGEKQVWKESTKENSLFLSTAVQLNSEKLKPVHKWFNEKLKPILGDLNHLFSASKCKDRTSRKLENILNLIKAADLTIKDIKVEHEELSKKHLPDDLPDDIRSKLIEELGNKKLFNLNVKTIHHDSSGNQIEFDLDEESDGTKKLFAYAGPWLDVLENGYILLVDELHDNFHPKIVQFLVELFHRPEINKNGAQLIFTTHDTSILNQDVFRRDQIWFCEKDNVNSTILYPLTDFSPRKDREDLEAGYLSGRYGALPYVRDFLTLWNQGE